MMGFGDGGACESNTKEQCSAAAKDGVFDSMSAFISIYSFLKHLML